MTAPGHASKAGITGLTMRLGVPEPEMSSLAATVRRLAGYGGGIARH
jgi:hypothetical protein